MYERELGSSPLGDVSRCLLAFPIVFSMSSTPLINLRRLQVLLFERKSEDRNLKDG